MDGGRCYLVDGWWEVLAQRCLWLFRLRFFANRHRRWAPDLLCFLQFWTLFGPLFLTVFLEAFLAFFCLFKKCICGIFNSKK
jgi:hypothetical protein